MSPCWPVCDGRYHAIRQGGFQITMPSTPPAFHPQQTSSALRQHDPLRLCSYRIRDIKQVPCLERQHRRPVRLWLKRLDLVPPAYPNVPDTIFAPAPSIHICRRVSSSVMKLTQSVPPTFTTWGAPALFPVPVGA